MSSHAWAIGGGVLMAVLAIGILFLALAILTVVQAYKAQRTWWVYLICMFIGPLNLVAIIAWFAHFRKNPKKVGPITL